MRNFKGFVQYGNTLASMYEDNGQTYFEPISSFSQANSVIDNPQQQNQGGSMSDQIGQQVGKHFMNKYLGSAGGNAGASASASGTSAGPGASASSGAGMGAMGYGAIIAAAIAAQHAMSNSTDREFEGVKTDDAFSGHYGTEPWQAFMYDKLGIGEFSAGEKFDASVEKGDWGQALKRAPSMLNYWANPAGSIAYDVTKDKLGGTIAFMADPASWLFDKLGG